MNNLDDNNLIDNVINCLTLDDPNGYIPIHTSKEFKNRKKAIKNLLINNFISTNEKIEVEIPIDNLPRKIMRNKHNPSIGKKAYYYDLKQIYNGCDGIYDIKVYGDIYKISLLSDNDVIMKIINKDPTNTVIKFPVFNYRNPIPVIDLDNTLSFMIEMNQNFNQNFNESIIIKMSCNYYNKKYRKCIIKNPINIQFNNGNKLLILAGMCNLINEEIPTYIL